jgi:hypothetical protein
MAIALAGTVDFMRRTKRVDPEILDHFGRELERWVREECEDNRTKAGRVLGLSQGHVSAMIRGLRGPGLPVLVMLAQKTGRTVDSWLFPESEMSREDRILSQLAEMKAGVDRLTADLPVVAPPKGSPDAPRPRRRQ